MIYICHGEDNLASYNRLQSIILQYKNFQKITFDDKDSDADFLCCVNAQDLIVNNKIFVLENFISKKKITPQILKSINSDNPIIIWEKSKISITKFIHQNIKIEEFKLPSKIFNFLDSVQPDSKYPFLRLNSLESKDEQGLLWQLSNRVFLLILFKLNIARIEVENITGKTVRDWQWRKIAEQSQRFNIDTLKALFAGILKIDYMIKLGRTDLQTKTLISVLFLKYLKS